MQGDTPVALIVEGDPGRADRYAAWLREECEVRVAHDTCAALDAVDEVDLVILGGGRPDRVRTILDEIHGHDADVSTVAVTGEGDDDRDPAPDERLGEPLSAEALRDAVAGILARRAYSRAVHELFAVATERAAVESGEGNGVSAERRRELEARVEELREQVDDTLDELVENAGFTAAYRAVDDVEPQD